jgi:glutaredoxin
MGPTINLTLIGKAGCHLCDEARDSVNAVIDAFKADHSGEDKPQIQVTLVEHDILKDDDLRAKYAEEIPVLLINGQIHNYWRIDSIRLREALDAFVL